MRVSDSDQFRLKNSRLKEPGTPVAAFLCLLLSWVCILGGVLITYYGITEVDTSRETNLFIASGIIVAIMGAPIDALGTIANNSEKNKHYQRYMSQILDSWDVSKTGNTTEEKQDSWTENIVEEESDF